MEIKVYKPQSFLLQQYIECFYTLKRNPNEKDIAYAAFPSIFSIICLNAEATLKSTGKGNLTFIHNPNNKLTTSLMCDYEHSGWVRYKGAADEIVIYFKPLGINQFLEKPLRKYVNFFVVDFKPFDDYQQAIGDIFRIHNDDDRIRALENYWLSKHKGFEHALLHRVVAEMMQESPSSSISETAIRNGISRTTLVKHFNLHLCTTPSQFRKVIRFRSAMTLYRRKITERNLADISCDADYFDQSHMVKDFKTLTKYSPKEFFSKLSMLEDGHINWLFRRQG